jgi:hypothetical protein
MAILEKAKTLGSAGNRNPDYPVRDLKNALLAMLPVSSHRMLPSAEHFCHKWPRVPARS